MQRDPRNASEAELNHVAMLVADVDLASKYLASQFGIVMTSQRQEQRVVCYGGREVTEQLTFAYATRPPYVELIQASGDGVFSGRRGLGLHHVGGFGDPSLRDLRETEEVEEVATIHSPDGAELVAVLYRTPALPGVLLEQVDAGRREKWSQWLSSH